MPLSPVQTAALAALKEAGAVLAIEPRTELEQVTVAGAATFTAGPTIQVVTVTFPGEPAFAVPL